jgi:polysaccharide export outer membrane protein
MDGPTVPVIYTVSFADPGGYFLASRVQMHNKDIIFAANAQSVEIEKFTTLLNAIISVPNNVAATGNEFEVWRINSHIR